MPLVAAGDAALKGVAQLKMPHIFRHGSDRHQPPAGHHAFSAYTESLCTAWICIVSNIVCYLAGAQAAYVVMCVCGTATPCVQLLAVLR
jgi:hypothetical protein